MRVIAGTARGRPLKLPRRARLRPTADRVKETVFNVLGQWFDGERVLDLYAGVGSLGIEALSRGAGHATFVERDPDAMAALSDNLRTLGFAAATTTLLKPADRAIRWLGGQGDTFAVVFSDPPYAAEAGESTLRALADAGLVAANGRVIIEHDKRELLPERVGPLERVDERRFGDTTVSFYRLAA